MKLLRLYSAAALFLTTLTASAQHGCVNSPEGSTIALAVVGAAGIFTPAIKRRIQARRQR